MVESTLQLLRQSWLPAGSFLAGVLNSIAGGGSFLSLPALFATAGAASAGAVSVQATNTVALWPGQLTGMIAFRKELREYGWELFPLGVASGLGGCGNGQAGADQQLFLLLERVSQEVRDDRGSGAGGHDAGGNLVQRIGSSRGAVGERP